jgi:hypothetical protein
MIGKRVSVFVMSPEDGFGRGAVAKEELHKAVKYVATQPKKRITSTYFHVGFCTHFYKRIEKCPSGTMREGDVVFVGYTMVAATPRAWSCELKNGAGSTTVLTSCLRNMVKRRKRRKQNG